MREKYEAMGNEMIRSLGFENKKVILFWKAFEEERWLACELHYGCFKKGLTKQSTLGIIIIVNEKGVNAMRKYNEIIVGVVMFLLVFIVLPGLIGNYEHHYTREAEVVEVSDDLIVVEDNCGYLWEFYGNDYEVGQQIKMKMFTNYTHDTIFDDEIEKVEIRD